VPELLEDDVRRRSDLRRMKAVAGGLLLLAAVLYVVARRADSPEGPAWAGWLRAAAEAGMVGGLADWFAVTALFRWPLGLPIPHTALIPTRKDALGRSLGDFVGTNFLGEEVVRRRLRGAAVAARVGSWLARPASAERVAGELAVAVRAATDVLRDEDVQAVLEETLLPRLLELPVAPPAGRVLEEIVAEGAHHGLVDLGAEFGSRWLAGHRDLVVRVVLRQAPTWSPAWLDERVAGRVYAEVLRFTEQVRDDRDHPARQALDRWLAALAQDLQHDPATRARAEAVKERLLTSPEVRSAAGSLAALTRRLLLEALADPTSELRRRMVDWLIALGSRLADDPALQATADRLVEDAAAHVVTTYQSEINATITQTVDQWDGQQTARKVELQVGRDLQFIRINGTVVGALAGLAIHAAGLAL